MSVHLYVKEMKMKEKERENRCILVNTFFPMCLLSSSFSSREQDECVNEIF
jgi:hypothetical protein